MSNIICLLIFVTVPAALIFICRKVPAVNKLGVVLLCYLFGMLAGNIGILPGSFVAPGSGGDSPLTLLQSISICIGLPLVLFSLDIKGFFKTAK